MTEDEFANLKPGDIVQSANGSGHFIITGWKSGGGFIAIQQVDVNNPHEWRQVPPPPPKVKRGFAS